MLYMKEMRPVVQAECTLKESAAINQLLGRRVRNYYWRLWNIILNIMHETPQRYLLTCQANNAFLGNFFVRAAATLNGHVEMVISRFKILVHLLNEFESFGINKTPPKLCRTHLNFKETCIYQSFKNINLSSYYDKQSCADSFMLNKSICYKYTFSDMHCRQLR